MKKRNILIGVLGIMMVIVLSVGATAAYLTDKGEKVNTFTVGNLEIGLTEPSWDDTVDGKLMQPGYVTQKDPTVVAIDGDSYMRVTVEFVSTNSEEMTEARVSKIMKTLNYEGENSINTTAFEKDEARSTAAKHVYVYKNEFKKGDTAVLFDTVRIPAEWTKTDLAQVGTYKLIIRAEAIQSYSFENAEAAFNMLDKSV